MNPYAGKGGSEEEPISLDDEDEVVQSGQELPENPPDIDDAVVLVASEDLKNGEGTEDELDIVDQDDVQAVDVSFKIPPGLDPQETAVEFSPVLEGHKDQITDPEEPFDREMDLSPEPTDTSKRAATEDSSMFSSLIHPATVSKKVKEGD